MSRVKSRAKPRRKRREYEYRYHVTVSAVIGVTASPGHRNLREILAKNFQDWLHVAVEVNPDDVIDRYRLVERTGL